MPETNLAWLSSLYLGSPFWGHGVLIKLHSCSKVSYSGCHHCKFQANVLAYLATSVTFFCKIIFYTRAIILTIDLVSKNRLGYICLPFTVTCFNQKLWLCTVSFYELKNAFVTKRTSLQKDCSKRNSHT